jgi:putative MATE family efflux protein
VRGSHHQDYTEGSIGQSIVLLAVPMVLEMAMESIFAVADVFWVAHLGPNAVATVGLTESLMTLVYTLAIGLSIGATATVARRIGEHDREGAARTAVQVVALGVVVSAILGIAGAIWAPALLGFMGGDAELRAMGSSFARVMLGGNVTVFLLFLINAVLRGSGDAAAAMRGLWLANAINIVLGPLLIFGVGPLPQMGVTGAAVATTIGRGVGVCYAASRLVRADGRLAVARRHLRLDLGLMARLVKLSGAGTFQVLVNSASWMVLTRVLASFGSDVLAGNTIAMRTVMFALLPAWGLSNAAATLVGQSLGARKPERAETAVWRAARYNLVFLGSIGAVFVLFAPQVVRLFTTDPAVVTVGATALRIIGLGFPCYAYGMVLTQAFNGAGDTWTPTVINLGIFWAVEIPLAYGLAHHTPMGPTGVFVAITLCFSALAGISAVLFRRGGWKGRTV